MGRQKKDTRYINTCLFNKARNGTAELSKQGCPVMGDSLIYLPCWNTVPWKTQRGNCVVSLGIIQQRRVRSWLEHQKEPLEAKFPKEEKSHRWCIIDADVPGVLYALGTERKITFEKNQQIVNNKAVVTSNYLYTTDYSPCHSDKLFLSNSGDGFWKGSFQWEKLPSPEDQSLAVNSAWTIRF